MRCLFIIGLAFFLAIGCGEKPVPQEAARIMVDAPPGIVLSNERPQAKPDPADDSHESAPGDYTIPQDRARMEARSREWLEWNQQSLGVAYDKIGKRNAKWDAQARDALDLAARKFTLLAEPVGSQDDLHAAAQKAIDAGCDDPMILYLFARTSNERNCPELQEFDRRTQKAADAMLASSYSPLRRAFARMALVDFKAWKEHFSPEDRQEIGNELDAILDLIPKSVAEDKRGEFWETRWYELITSVLGTHRRLTGDYKAAYDRVDGKLAKVQGIEALRLVVRGNFMFFWGWEARTKAFAPFVGEERFRTFESRLEEARSALEEAWKINPGQARVGTLMIDIEKATGGGDRTAMELWFKRAMETDCNDRDACWSKLDWLDPKWHGDANRKQMLSFGKQCAETKNWRNGITLLAGDAHYRYIQRRPAADQAGYMTKPAVWNEIKSVYDEYLKHYPDDDAARSKYAVLCYIGTHYLEAHTQFEILGDRLRQWDQFPYVPMESLKKFREHTAQIVAAKKKA